MKGEKKIKLAINQHRVLNYVCTRTKIEPYIDQSLNLVRVYPKSRKLFLNIAHIFFSIDDKRREFPNTAGVKYLTDCPSFLYLIGKKLMNEAVESSLLYYFHKEKRTYIFTFNLKGPVGSSFRKQSR